MLAVLERGDIIQYHITILCTNSVVFYFVLEENVRDSKTLKALWTNTVRCRPFKVDMEVSSVYHGLKYIVINILFTNLK